MASAPPRAHLKEPLPAREAGGGDIREQYIRMLCAAPRQSLALRGEGPASAEPGRPPGPENPDHIREQYIRVLCAAPRQPRPCEGRDLRARSRAGLPGREPQTTFASSKSGCCVPLRDSLGLAGGRTCERGAGPASRAGKTPPPHRNRRLSRGPRPASPEPRRPPCLRPRD